MLKQSFYQISEKEITLSDLVYFFLESWKRLILSVVLGILGATIYIGLTPNQYQATAQIQMAQISINNNANAGTNSNTGTNSFIVNVEDSNSVMARLKLPTAYSTEEIKACGLETSEAPFEKLASIIKFSGVKGGAVIELKINLNSKEIAISCAQALFENIKRYQNQIIKPDIEEAKVLLLKNNDRLANLQILIAEADKFGPANLAAYFSSRDEVKFLLQEVLRLNSFIAMADSKQTKLLSPIYVPASPVFPNKKIIILIGVMTGLFLGFFSLWIRRYWQSTRDISNTLLNK